MSSRFNLLDVDENALMSILYCIVISDPNIFSMMQRVCKRFTTTLFMDMMLHYPLMMDLTRGVTGFPCVRNLTNARLVMLHVFQKHRQMHCVRSRHVISDIAIGPGGQVAMMYQRSEMFSVGYRVVGVNGQVTFLENDFDITVNESKLDYVSVTSIKFGGEIRGISAVKNYILMGIIDLGVLVIGVDLVQTRFISIDKSHVNDLTYYLGVPNGKNWMFFCTYSNQFAILDMAESLEKWSVLDESPVYNNKCDGRNVLCAEHLGASADGNILVMSNERGVFVFDENKEIKEWVLKFTPVPHVLYLYVVHTTNPLSGPPSNWVIAHCCLKDEREQLSTFNIETGAEWIDEPRSVSAPNCLKSLFCSEGWLFVFDKLNSYKILRPVVETRGDGARVLSLLLLNRVTLHTGSHTSIRGDICLVGTQIWTPAFRNSQNVLLVSERSRIAVDGFVKDLPEGGAAGGAAAGGAGGAGS